MIGDSPSRAKTPGSSSSRAKAAGGAAAGLEHPCTTLRTSLVQEMAVLPSSGGHLVAACGQVSFMQKAYDKTSRGNSGSGIGDVPAST